MAPFFEVKLMEQDTFNRVKEKSVVGFYATWDAAVVAAMVALHTEVHPEQHSFMMAAENRALLDAMIVDLHAAPGDFAAWQAQHTAHMAVLLGENEGEKRWFARIDDVEPATRDDEALEERVASIDSQARYLARKAKEEAEWMAGRRAVDEANKRAREAKPPPPPRDTALDDAMARFRRKQAKAAENAARGDDE